VDRDQAKGKETMNKDFIVWDSISATEPVLNTWDHRELPSVQMDLETLTPRMKELMDKAIICDAGIDSHGIADIIRNNPDCPMICVDSHDHLNPEMVIIPSQNEEPPKRTKKNPDLRGALAFATMLGWNMPLPKIHQKDMKKCLLPGCEVLHSHNGGYCKADHCREHNRILKAERMKK
jgi:hypothetical protein